MGPVLVVVGLVVAAVGALVWLGVPLGRLPGDIAIEREQRSASTCPITTSLARERRFHARQLAAAALGGAGTSRRSMAIKSDRWIREMALEHGMIEPFEDRQVRAGRRLVRRLSSYGYDIRVADEFKVFTNINNTVIDPKNFDPQSFVDIKADVCIVPPNSFALARTVEYFRIPRDVLTICLGKSTYARCGIIVNVTPFEPEWEGHVHDRDLQHHAAAGEDLRQRRHRAGAVLPERRAAARCPTRTRRASTRSSAASRCRRSERGLGTRDLRASGRTQA